MATSCSIELASAKMDDGKAITSSELHVSLLHLNSYLNYYEQFPI